MRKAALAITERNEISASVLMAVSSHHLSLGHVEETLGFRFSPFLPLLVVSLGSVLGCWAAVTLEVPGESKVLSHGFCHSCSEQATWSLSDQVCRHVPSGKNGDVFTLGDHVCPDHFSRSSVLFVILN